MTLLDFKIYYKVTVSRKCDAGKGETNRSMKQNREPRKQAHINTFTWIRQRTKAIK